MGRAGTDDDVAGLVILFVSDHAAHISGQMINVDGGSVRS
jgi:NAD(P)-dependent dehydrogenase (short-subunit alcohol dehydrogenase family)